MPFHGANLSLCEVRTVPTPVNADRIPASHEIEIDERSHAMLIALVGSAVGVDQFEMYYQDDEGDMIKCASEMETMEMLNQAAERYPFRLYVVHAGTPAPVAEAAPAAEEERGTLADEFELGFLPMVDEPVPTSGWKEEEDVKQTHDQEVKGDTDVKEDTDALKVNVDLGPLGVLELEMPRNGLLSTLKQQIEAITGVEVSEQILQQSFKPPHNVVCDCCEEIIREGRFKCARCDDYDLCARCHAANLERNFHAHEFFQPGVMPSPPQEPEVCVSEAEATAPVVAAPPAEPAPHCTRPADVPVRHAAVCDFCNRAIVGIRYKCYQCDDYDLCERCEERNGEHLFHDASHFFVKLRRPIPIGTHFQQQRHPEEERIMELEQRTRELRREVRQLVRKHGPPGRHRRR